MGSRSGIQREVGLGCRLLAQVEMHMELTCDCHGRRQVRPVETTRGLQYERQRGRKAWRAADITQVPRHGITGVTGTRSSRVPRRGATSMIARRCIVIARVSRL